MIQKTLAFILLILCSPILVISSILIYLTDGFPIIFRQKKYGLKETVFNQYKFRTMYVNSPNISTDQLNDSRSYIIPKLAFLRKISIDELPQLINIIRGDLNFIGPRAGLIENEEELYKLRKKFGIFNLKPGITGWAQVNGRDLNSVKKKVELDYYYLRNKSFTLNALILVKTFITIFDMKTIKH